MKYYLPVLLEALGLEYRVALMAGAVEMTVKIGLTVIEMWIIDRVGRRACIVGGSAVMGVAMLVRSCHFFFLCLFPRFVLYGYLQRLVQINGLLPLFYPNNVNKAANAVCIFFIFVYAMGYSLGLGPAAWVYSSEVSLLTPHQCYAFPPVEPFLTDHGLLFLCLFVDLSHLGPR